MDEKKGNQPEQDLKFIAQQLRKPSGNFSGTIAGKMDMVNSSLFDLTLETMQVAGHDRILEIGFGSGTFFKKLLSEADRVSAWGIDYSEEMVGQAKKLNSDLIASGELNLHMGNSNHLQFDDNFFDKVFCNMVIYFWDNPSEHLREVHRVLKPGGVFYTGFRPKKSMLQFPFVKHDFNLYEESDWTSILEENDFVVTGVKKKTDPDIDGEEGTIRLESVCIIAET